MAADGVRAATESCRVAESALRGFGVRGELSPLAGERDWNFRVIAVSDDESFVLKIAPPGEDASLIDFQNRAMMHLAGRALPITTPRIVPATDGDWCTTVEDEAGRPRSARLLTFVPGTPMAEVEKGDRYLFRDLGRAVALVDQALADFDHAAADRSFRWNLLCASETIRTDVDAVEDGFLRNSFEKAMHRLEARHRLLDALPRSVIHNDANDHNVMISAADGEPARVSGLIDFGDLCRSYTIGGLAVAATYAMLDQPDPIGVMQDVVAGYAAVRPIGEAEAEAIGDLIRLRVLTSIVSAARQHADQPENEYLLISQKPMRSLLAQLAAIEDDDLRDALLCAGGKQGGAMQISTDRLRAERAARIGPSLSVSYHRPLTIVRGEGQYLFDDRGEAYLDCVNNVCHVGHCHPDVVRAGAEQAAILNTNTRYLHPLLTEYATRLAATLPAGLDVCYFVSSGSEANELALRLARTYTQARDLVVLEAGYHGNTQALIEASSYKFAGPGGFDPPPWIHPVTLPDVYRGRCRNDPAAGEQFANDVARAVKEIAETGGRCAAMLVEAMPGCGGQIILPPDYLRHAFTHVRNAGGVCIADEVQTGFGRPGTHFWAFQTQGVVPDIVTMGKPIGNGHPIGAVVTSRAIADAFDNGMEYFNTFGGNPVSCAIGLEVLNVIEREALQQHALEVGNELMTGLRELQQRHALIGDVRGIGLYIGVELVRDRMTLEPAADEATAIINRLRDDHHMLLSTDGPLHNVLKIKPPMVFTSENARAVCTALDAALR